MTKLERAAEEEIVLKQTTQMYRYALPLDILAASDADACGRAPEMVDLYSNPELTHAVDIWVCVQV